MRSLRCLLILFPCSLMLACAASQSNEFSTEKYLTTERAAEAKQREEWRQSRARMAAEEVVEIETTEPAATPDSGDGISIEFDERDLARIREAARQRQAQADAAEVEKYGKVLTESDRAELDAYGRLLTDEEREENAAKAEEEAATEEARLAEEAAKAEKLAAEAKAKKEREAAEKEAKREESLKNPQTRLEWLKAAGVLPEDTPDSVE